jgi:hypothetical protein
MQYFSLDIKYFLNLLIDILFAAFSIPVAGSGIFRVNAPWVCQIENEKISKLDNLFKLKRKLILFSPIYQEMFEVCCCTLSFTIACENIAKKRFSWWDHEFSTLDPWVFHLKPWVCQNNIHRHILCKTLTSHVR